MISLSDMLGKLFVYGTLQVPEVQRDLTGKVFEARPAWLDGYRCRTVLGQWYPAIVPHEGGQVIGLLLHEVDEATLLRLDRYEGDQYQRVALVVSADAGDTSAWCYVLKPEFEDRLSDEPWDLRRFVGEREQKWTP